MAADAHCTQAQALSGLLLAMDDVIEARGGVAVDGQVLPPMDADFMVPDPTDRPHVQRAREAARPIARQALSRKAAS